MFSYVKLKNYKSLIDLDVNLCSKKDSPKKMIVIYGENGTGKSNFISCFDTLKNTVATKSVKKLLEKFIEDDDLFKDTRRLKDRLVDIGFFKKSFSFLEGIIKNCKTIGSTEHMVLEFGFKIKGKKGVYRLETNDTNIVYERLEYVFNKNQTKFFEISTQKTYLNEEIFQNSNYEKELCDLIEKYWGKHSLLALLIYEIEDKKEGYVKKRMSKSFMDVLIYFMTVSSTVKDEISEEYKLKNESLSQKILVNFKNGTIPITDESKLNKTEKMLNEFFTHLYSDIKEVYYEKNIKNNKIHYQLFVKKLMYDTVIDINFNLESTGTQQLLHILYFLIPVVEDKTVLIDELDTGIHDVLVTSLLENISESITGQLIITTHNTMLLESEINKDCIYIFSADKDAKKELVPLSSFGGRVHPNLNMRKRYLQGLYGGVPIAMDVDFSDLVQIIK